MDDNKPDARTIAAEAVGERTGDSIPEAVKDAERRALEKAEEVIGQPATQAASSTSDKTAESLGERVGDAYADPAKDAPRKWSGDIGRGNATQAGPQARGTTNDALTAGRQVAQIVSRQFDKQPFLTALAAFGLGYITSLFIHGHR